MYSLLLFLKKTDNKEVNNLFNDYVLKYLSEITGEPVKAGYIESSLLLETRYSRFCEINLSSKDEWDKKINSPAGKKLNKCLADIHQYIDIIFINYPDGK